MLWTHFQVFSLVYPMYVRCIKFNRNFSIENVNCSERQKLQRIKLQLNYIVIIMNRFKWN